jgi:hypothetical protein
MNELMIFDHIREHIDPFLIDQVPGRNPDLVADHSLIG